MPPALPAALNARAVDAGKDETKPKVSLAKPPAK
jgi:hypothetical protein